MAAAAAVLVLGIVIGRLWIPGEETLRPTAIRQVEGERGPETQDTEEIYRYATARHLSRADALLTHFRSTAAAGESNGVVSDWAKELLSETRLFLRSPAAQDGDLRRLLRDLELVLALIVQSADATRAEDQEWVRKVLDDRDILPRLRARTPADRIQSNA